MTVAAQNNRIAGCEKGFEITFSDDNLQAFLYLNSKDLEMQEVTPQDVIRNMNLAGVVYGLDKKAIENIAEHKLLDQRHIVAAGLPPENGRDAAFEFCFDPREEIVAEESEDGRIDYSDVNILQNAEPGQILVKKIPVTEGKAGRTVTNEEIPPMPGEDKKMPKGINTELSLDGLTLSAAKAGTIVYSGSAVSVQPMTVATGSIDLSTGSIHCRGSLRVLKDIKSGVRVEVDGDLEVCGNVEDAEVICKGNVLIKGGFLGCGKGVLKALGDVTVRYVINQTINSGGNITIGGEAVNAHIQARDQINLQGTRGKVVGGLLTARDLIRATTFGANDGTKTVLKVGYDAELMRQDDAIAAEMERFKRDGERVRQALIELYRLKVGKKLPQPREAILTKLENFHKNLPEQLKRLADRQREIEKKLAEFKSAAVIAEKSVYPGVQVYFGRQHKSVTRVRGPLIVRLIDNTIIPATPGKNTFDIPAPTLEQ